MGAWDSYKVDVPEGALDGVAVERFSLDSEASTWTYVHDGGRGIPPGDYTRLIVGKNTWMSDTPAEIGDHWPVMEKIHKPSTSSVLVNGLGLGMIVKYALAHEHVTSVDVVENDKRIIELVGPTYTSDGRVTIHEADAYDIEWPARRRWDIAWHDVWLDLDYEKNLPGMSRLHRKYGTRVGWQGSWGKNILLRERAAARRHEELWG
jgi:hypothetical protein